jgi:hypothetical protein
MGGSGQLGQPMATAGGQMAQAGQPEQPRQPVPPNGAAMQPGPGQQQSEQQPTPALTMQPTQTATQPPSGAFKGSGVLSSVAAPGQYKMPGMSQSKFGGT